MADWRDRRVPEFQSHLRNVLGREPTERDYAAAIMQLEARGPGSIAVGHAFRNRVVADGGDAASHLRHYDPVALGHRWREVTPAAIDKWGSEYDKIAAGEGPLRPGQTHFFSPSGMQAYYDKDPSLVRSAVRMDVPGHGEVLVPSWATKAVGANDFVNVNGQWHLTPNERYGQDAAPPAPSRDPTPRQDVASAPPSRDPPLRAPDTDRSAITSPSSGGQAIETAMRVARAFGGSQPEQETESIIETRTGGMPRPRQMADVPIPYMDKVKKPMILTRADGGPVDPPAGGAGRFASPVPLTQTGDTDTFARRMIDRLTGVGRLPYADGGGIDDTGVNMPETRDALMAQQRQLIEGRRPAQMFPRGTEELPVPPGMRRLETSRGVFHYDPMQVSARDIEMASIDGRENEVLGLGPLNKSDVSDIGAQTGEGPVAITERDTGGNEVRASVATPSTVPLQADEILRSAAPGHSVDVEPVGDVVGRRQEDGMDRSADRALMLARAEGGEISQKPRPAELTEWAPPWHDRIAYGIGDAMDSVRGLFGYEPLSTGQRYGVNETVRTAPIFKDVRGVDIESKNARRSYDEGDYLGAAGNLGMAGLHGLALAGPAHAAQTAVRGMPSVRQINRDTAAWEANTPRGRARGDVASGDRAFDELAKRVDKDKLQKAADDAGGMDVLRKDFEKTLNPIDWLVYKFGGTGTYGGEQSKLKSFFSPGHLALQSGNLAAQDYMFDLGVMPWSWNKPGTLQHKLRNGPPPSAAERITGQPDSNFKYPPRFPRLERTDEQMRERYESTRTGGVKDNKYGIFGGGKLSFDEWLKLQEKYGGTLHHPTDRYYVAPHLYGLGPGPYKAAPDIESIGRASGGGIGGGPIVGALAGATGGRADKIPGTARPGSHVLPADVVAHMGQGNTNAGLRALERMFKTGPYGMALSGRRRGFADGGEVEADIPVMLSDGEFVVPPEVVASLGDGDIQTGHDVLDAWIMGERAKHIETLQALPPPATD